MVIGGWVDGAGVPLIYQQLECDIVALDKGTHAAIYIEDEQEWPKYSGTSE